MLADIVSRDRDGDLIATPAEWEEELGPLPRIIVFAPRKPRPGLRQGFLAPGIGDRALLRVSPLRETGGPGYSGRVVKILSRAAKRVLGIFREDPRGGGGRIVPVDKKMRDKEFRGRRGRSL